MNYEEMVITGMEVNYYFICKYKLWLFSHFISYEQDSELVKLGKVFHDIVLEKERKKEINFGSIKIDVIKKRKDYIEIHEIKKSKRAETAHFYQLLYYLYYLKNYGIKALGYLKYPVHYKIIKVTLSEQNEERLKNVLKEIEKIKNSDIPPKKEHSKFCKPCAYFDFCWC